MHLAWAKFRNTEVQLTTLEKRKTTKKKKNKVKKKTQHRWSYTVHRGNIVQTVHDLNIA